MIKFKITGLSEEKLKLIAYEIKNKYKMLPKNFLLEGEVGAGKTTFTRYLIEAFESNKDFSSPTYGIVNEYTDIDGISALYHFDLYRIDQSDYAWIEEKIEESNSICVFEWASLHTELIQDVEYVTFSLSYESLSLRTLEIVVDPSFRIVFEELLLDVGIIFEVL